MILCFLERPTAAEEVKKCWSENLQQELTAHQSVWWNCRHPRRLGWLELITLVSNDNLPMSSSTTTLHTTAEVEGFTSFPSILRTTDSKTLRCLMILFCIGKTNYIFQNLCWPNNFPIDSYLMKNKQKNNLTNAYSKWKEKTHCTHGLKNFVDSFEKRNLAR